MLCDFNLYEEDKLLLTKTACRTSAFTEYKKCCVDLRMIALRCGHVEILCAKKVHSEEIYEARLAQKSLSDLSVGQIFVTDMNTAKSVRGMFSPSRETRADPFIGICGSYWTHKISQNNGKCDRTSRTVYAAKCNQQIALFSHFFN